MIRRIVGLKWATRIDSPRPFGGISNVRGREKRDGIKFEQLVERAIPQAERGIWWGFCDSNGTGMCQTDFILRMNESVVIIETKRTDCEDAQDQLRNLYIPVVRSALGARVVGVVLVKNLTQRSKNIVSSIEEAVEMGKKDVKGRCPVVLWNTKGRIPLLMSEPFDILSLHDI